MKEAEWRESTSMSMLYNPFIYLFIYRGFYAKTIYVLVLFDGNRRFWYGTHNIIYNI